MWDMGKSQSIGIGVVCGAVMFVCGEALAETRPQANGGASKAPAVVAEETFALSKHPLYALSPEIVGKVEPNPPAAEPLLVPLPPGALAALSSLVGLAAVATWRKYRFRPQ